MLPHSLFFPITCFIFVGARDGFVVVVVVVVVVVFRSKISSRSSREKLSLSLTCFKINVAKKIFRQKSLERLKYIWTECQLSQSIFTSNVIIIITIMLLSASFLFERTVIENH